MLEVKSIAVHNIIGRGDVYSIDTRDISTTIKLGDEIKITNMVPPVNGIVIGIEKMHYCPIIGVVIRKKET